MSFSNIVGQDIAISILKKVLKGGRVAHAYLFAGPDGVGKSLATKAFAKALICEVQKEEDSCDSCTSCKKVDSASHPDVYWVSPSGPKGLIKIKEIKELRRRATFKPYEARHNIFVIEGADALTEEAGNSLLKVLEEPPSECILILIASNLTRVLPTILSRCQTIRFTQISPRRLKGYLIESFGLSETDAHLLTSMAGGSLGRAVRFMESGLLERRGEIVNSFLKIGSGEELADSLEETFDRFSDKEELREAIELLALLFRDMIFLKVGAEKDFLANPDMKEVLEKFSADFSTEDIAEVLQKLREFTGYMDQSVNPKLILPVLLNSINNPQGNKTYV